jgi:pSer/pThr/pTyr-binding forkhead associated (FHA) protein
MVTIKIYKGENFIKELTFQEENIMIGRVLSNDICIDDPSISRLHASIEIKPDNKVIIFDLGSANGILVNNNKVKEQELKSGDSITIGNATLVITIEKAPKTKTSEKEKYVEITSDQILIQTELIKKKDIGIESKKERLKDIQEEIAEEFPGKETTIVKSIDKKYPKVLETIMLWNDSIFDIRHFAKYDEISIGEDKKNTFYFDSPSVPSKFPLIRFENQKHYLYFMDHYTGEIRYENKMRTLLDLKKDSDIKEETISSHKAYKVPLALDSKSMIHIGNISFFIQFVRPSKKYKINYVKSIDKFFGLVLLFVALIHIVLLSQKPTSSSELDLNVIFKKQNRFTKLIFLPRNVMDKVKINYGDTKNNNKAKTNGGGGSKEATLGRELGKRVGINVVLKELSTKKGFLGEIFQTGGLGKSIDVALGGIKSASGQKGGVDVGMLGIKGIIGGTGTGGGGLIGPGDLGVGGDSAQKQGYAKKYGKVEKAESQITVSEEGTIILGALTREEVARVIQSHIAQLGYCYDLQLLGDPNLHGKIEVTWTIGTNGNVVDVKIKNTTLKNKYVEECVLRRISSWVFPKPRGGGEVEVSYPFIFASQSKKE